MLCVNDKYIIITIENIEDIRARICLIILYKVEFIYKGIASYSRWLWIRIIACKVNVVNKFTSK